MNCGPGVNEDSSWGDEQLSVAMGFGASPEVSRRQSGRTSSVDLDRDRRKAVRIERGEPRPGVG